MSLRNKKKTKHFEDLFLFKIISYKQKGTSNNISDNEYYEIEKVIQRAAMIDQKEMLRISRLYQRYNSMNKPQGNGDTECLICNCNFGLLAANPRICNNCLKVTKIKQTNEKTSNFISQTNDIIIFIIIIIECLLLV